MSPLCVHPSCSCDACVACLRPRSPRSPREASQLQAHGRARRIGAFTLLELILVLIVLSTVAAIAVPSLKGFRGWSRERDAAAQLVAVTQYAKSRAASDAKVYRLEIAPASYRLTVQEGLTFVPTRDEFGGAAVELPAGCKLELMPLASTSTPVQPGAIAFYPQGHADTALLRLTNSRGRVTLIACPSPAETVRVVSAEEAARL